MSFSINVSHSQRAKAEDCWRQWAFHYLAELEVPGDNYAAFKGGKTHEVIERWLKEEEPFPPGWNEGLTSEDTSRVRAFIDRGAAQGVLFRHPQQKVEEFFHVDLIPGVKIRGYIDWWLPDIIIDHKTSSSRRWMHATPESLAKDKQLLTYAKIHFDTYPDQDKVQVRHNQFVWSPGFKDIHALTATVTRDEAEENWKELQEISAIMLDLHRNKATLDILKDLDPPDDPRICTSKYGGCVYQSICSGTVRQENFLERLSGPKLSDLFEDNDMKIIPNNPRPGLISGAAASPLFEAEAPPSTEVSLKEIQGRLFQNDALWALPDCDLCGGSGWLVLGEEPCLECQEAQLQRLEGGSANGVNPEHFEESGQLRKQYDEWGAFYKSLYRFRRDGDRPEPEPKEPEPEPEPEQPKLKTKEPEPEQPKLKTKGPKAQPVEWEEDEEEEEPKPVPKRLQKVQPLRPEPEPEQPKLKTKEPEPEPEPEVDTLAPPAPAKLKGKRGRAKEGLTLVRGAVHRTRTNKIYPFSSVWEELTKMAGFKDLKAYYEYHPFERRDLVCAQVAVWMAAHQEKMIVWHGPELSPDYTPVWELLTIHAQEIYSC
jgi:hypothetical protein